MGLFEVVCYDACGGRNGRGRRSRECCYIRQHTSAYVSMRQHTSIRQHASAYVALATYKRVQIQLHTRVQARRRQWRRLQLALARDRLLQLERDTTCCS